MYHGDPYEISFSNVSYVRSESIRAARQSIMLDAPTSDQNPYRLRSMAVFDDYSYYDCEEDSEMSSSLSDTSSSLSSPVTPAEDSYRNVVDSTRKANLYLPYSYDPKCVNPQRYGHWLTPAFPSPHAPLPSSLLPPVPVVPMFPPIAPPKAHSEYRVGRAFPDIQMPKSVRIDRVPPAPPADVEAHLQRLPNNQSMCKWRLNKVSMHPPKACGYKARSDMVRRHINAVHLKLK
jgi:hypothetical protein